MHHRLELTPDEKDFLTTWIWDEVHTEKVGSAKQAQIDHGPFTAPLLADIVVAAMTSEEQVAVADGPMPAVAIRWPWATDEALRARHRQARDWLEHSRFPRRSVVAQA